MLKIYFDNVLINEDSYTELSNDYQLFTDSFKLGSVASNSFKLSVNKTMVSIHPSEVKIEDDNTTFFLVVDSIEEDNYVYSYTLTDKLVNFNFNYDASVIIDEKKELEETCYLSDIWKDMCGQANIEYDDEYAFLNDIEVDWYDNTIQARKYLSYIAELQGGYACILENGKQSFKPYKKASSKTIDIDECSDFILGEKKTITRVVYDNGVMKWEFGDDTGTTAYIDSTNVFITTEETVENIYDTIEGFEFYLVNVPDAPIDSSIRAGDIITFTDGVNDYPTIAQYTMDFFGDWTGGYSLQVKTDKQEETKITGEKEKIKKIETNINRIDANLKITAEETDENSSSIAELQIASNEITTTVEDNKYYINENDEKVLISSGLSELEQTVSGLEVAVTTSGGNNLLINPVGLQDGEVNPNAYGWTGPCGVITNTDIKNNTFGKSALFLQNGTRSQIVQVPNGTYTISFLYKEITGLADSSIEINGYSIPFTTTSWTSGNYTFVVSSNTIEVKLISDTDNSCYVSDLMLNTGSIVQPYSSNATEVVTNNVQIGDGITISSTVSNTIWKSDTDGTRIYDTNDLVNPVTEFTVQGVDTVEINADKGQIGGILIKEQTIGTSKQTWISKL